MEKIKVALLGEGGVGKTSIAKRFSEDSFSSAYEPTIAVDYQNKLLTLPNVEVNINLWDFSGHPEFFEVRNEFYRDSDIILLVYDVSVSKTFQGLDMWINEASKFGASNTLVYVCANKCDKGGRVVSGSDGEQYAKSKGYQHWDTSAREGTNINEMFNDMVQKFLAKKKKK